MCSPSGVGQLEGGSVERVNCALVPYKERKWTQDGRGEPSNWKVGIPLGRRRGPAAQLNGLLGRSET
jgi:hypothetical protein